VYVGQMRADLQNDGGIHPRQGVNEDAGAAQPRSEHVGVGRLGPAGVRQVPVNIGLTQVHPVASCDGVTEPVAGTRHLRSDLFTYLLILLKIRKVSNYSTPDKQDKQN